MMKSIVLALLASSAVYGFVPSSYGRQAAPLFSAVVETTGTSRGDFSQMKDFPVRVRSRSAEQAAPEEDSLVAARREYFAQRIAEIRNRAVLRAQEMKEMKKNEQSSKGSTVLRTKHVKTSSQEYFATRVQECRKRTLMASIEAAKAAREKAAEMDRKNKRMFSLIRTRPIYHNNNNAEESEDKPAYA